MADIDKPDLLPLVQFALERLYEARKEEDGTATLTFAAYRALGALDGAIDKAAEEAFAALAPAEQDALPRLLRTLVATGVKGAAALRQAPLAEAAHDAGSKALVQALTEARVLVSSEGQYHAPMVALAHQRVIEAWERARNSVADSRVLMRVRDEVVPAAERWERDGRRRDLLIPPGLRLSEAEETAQKLGDELPGEAQLFVKASVAAARRRQRLLAGAAAVFAVTAVVAVGAALLAERRGREAAEQRDRAEKTLELATQTANALTFDIAQKFADYGLPAKLRGEILDRARQLQAQLAEGGGESTELKRSRYAALTEAAESRLATGDVKGALDAARQAVTIMEALSASDPGNAGWRRDLSVSYNKVGDVLNAQGDLPGALKAYRDALAIAERLSASDPGNAEWRRDLWVSKNKVGEVFVAQGDFRGAKAAHSDGLAIIEKLSASDPDNVGWRRDLSVSYEKVGDVLYAQGDFAGRPQGLSRQSGDPRATVGVGPRERRPAPRSLCELRKGRRRSLCAGDLPGAMAAYRDSLVILEKLSALDRGNAIWRRDLSVSYERIGNVLEAQGDLPGALKAYRDGLAIAEQLSASDSGNASWRRDLSVNYNKVGDVLKAQGDLPGALKAYRDSLAIRQKLSASDPGNVIWRHESLGELQQGRRRIESAGRSARCAQGLSR